MYVCMYVSVCVCICWCDWKNPVLYLYIQWYPVAYYPHFIAEIFYSAHHTRTHTRTNCVLIHCWLVNEMSFWFPQYLGAFWSRHFLAKFDISLVLWHLHGLVKGRTVCVRFGFACACTMHLEFCLVQWIENRKTKRWKKKTDHSAAWIYKINDHDLR